MQNTIVDKGGAKVLLDLCKHSDKRALPVLANACRALFHLSKNSTDACLVDRPTPPRRRSVLT